MTKTSKLLKLLSLGQFLQRLNDLGVSTFHMGHYRDKKGNNCGSHACAAGWSEVLFSDFKLPSYNHNDDKNNLFKNNRYIAEYFGISRKIAEKVFGSDGVYFTFAGHEQDPVYVGQYIERLAKRHLKTCQNKN